MKKFCCALVLLFGFFIVSVADADTPEIAAPYIIPLMYQSLKTDGVPTYYVQLKVSEPDPAYSMTTDAMLDTGSSVFLMPGGSYYCPNCIVTKSTNKNLSFNGFNAYPVINHYYSFNYGYISGLQASVNEYMGTLQLLNNAKSNPQALLSIPQYAFGVMANVIHKSNTGVEKPFLGLEPVAGANVGAGEIPSFMNNLISNDLIHQDTFGLLLCSKQGQSNFYVGGVDPALLNQQPAFTIPFNNTNLYALQQPISLQLNYGQTSQTVGLFSSVPTNVHNYMLDSGAPHLILTSGLFTDLIKDLEVKYPDIPTSFWSGTATALTSKTIASLPTLQLTFPNQAVLKVPPAHYLLNLGNGNYDFMIKSGIYVDLGAPVVESYYVQFDWQDHQAEFYSNQQLC